MPYAGPDGSKTLPEADAGKQLFVAWESSHAVCPTRFTEISPQRDAARLGSCARPDGANCLSPLMG
ncbi:hypothetical protein GCM10010446_43640 [Streptomyces enissocaesilis]|uniref:Uncharacterized protein n=1 Tax=Streptomyces enissocaesilis TaxID=332589 RepID=A0ABP6JXG8_9ACTN